MNRIFLDVEYESFNFLNRLFLLSLGLHTENHGQIFINVISVLTITKKQSFFNTCRLIKKTIRILFQCQLLNETAKRFDFYLT